MQVKWLVKDVWVCHETHLVSIANLSFSGWVVYALHIENTSSTWCDGFFARRTSISLINRANSIVHIENEASVCLLAHQQNVVFESEDAVLAVGVWHTLECFCESLLSKVDQELALVFFVEVFLLLVTVHVHVFGPITDTGCLSVSRST